jgi:hypothetical protein
VFFVIIQLTFPLVTIGQNDLFEEGADVVVSSITPATGSVTGGQRLHVDGNGFNLEFFEGSNVVTLIGEGVERNCVVVEGACTVDCGSSKRIVCEIEPPSRDEKLAGAPDLGISGTYDVKVEVNIPGRDTVERLIENAFTFSPALDSPSNPKVSC